MTGFTPAPQQPDGFYNAASYRDYADADINAEYHMKLGKTLYQSYLAQANQPVLDEAIQHFQRAVELEPDMAEAYVQLASAMWDQGAINLELAQYYCETAIRLEPSLASAHVLLGYFLQRAGFWDEAITQFERGIQKNFRLSGRPRIALGHTMLQQALTQASTFTQLTMALSGSLHVFTGCVLLPLDPQSSQMIQNALFGDIKAYTFSTLGKVFKTLGLKGMARSMYKAGTHAMPNDPLFYHILGDEHLFETGHYADALECYQKAREKMPHDLALIKKIGQTCMALKRNLEAATHLEEVLTQDPTDFDTLYSLAQIYLEDKQYMKSLYYFKEARAVRPHYPYVYSNMAYILFKLDDLEGSFEEYKTAMELGTDPLWLSTVAYTLATMAYQVQGDIPMAMEFVQQSIQYHPENTDAVTMLADLYFESGHLELAINAYKAVLMLDPNNGDCYSNIGFILWQMDHNEAAIDAYKAALEFDPTNAVAYNNLGVIFLDETQDPKKALPLFSKALELNPTYTLACFNLGRSYELQGNTLKAADLYTQALSLNTRSPELDDSEIEARLQGLFR